MENSFVNIAHSVAFWDIKNFSKIFNFHFEKTGRSIIKTYSDKAGIKKHITTHSLRHTFASDLLRETKNLRIVQKALGHADISSTQIYTHIVDEELEEALKGFRGR